MDPAWSLKLPWEYQEAWQPSRASHSLPGEGTLASLRAELGWHPAPAADGAWGTGGSWKDGGAEQSTLCQQHRRERRDTHGLPGKDKPAQEPHLLWHLQLGHKQGLSPASGSSPTGSPSPQPPSSGLQLHSLKSAPSLSYQQLGVTAEPGNSQCWTHGTGPSSLRFGEILSSSQEQRGSRLCQV